MTNFNVASLRDLDLSIRQWRTATEITQAKLALILKSQLPIHQVNEEFSAIKKSPNWQAMLAPRVLGAKAYHYGLASQAEDVFRGMTDLGKNTKLNKNQKSHLLSMCVFGGIAVAALAYTATDSGLLGAVGKKFMGVSEVDKNISSDNCNDELTKVKALNLELTEKIKGKDTVFANFLGRISGTEKELKEIKKDFEDGKVSNLSIALQAPTLQTAGVVYLTELLTYLANSDYAKTEDFKNKIPNIVKDISGVVTETILNGLRIFIQNRKSN